MKMSSSQYFAKLLPYGFNPFTPYHGFDLFDFLQFYCALSGRGVLPTY